MGDMSYLRFLERKAVSAPERGLREVPELNDRMFPHQKAVTEFLLRVGSGAAFLDTGLGKSLVSLDWGRVVAEHTGKPVLMLAPLAVSRQHEREARKFGIPAKIVRHPDEMTDGVNVCNYEMLHHFTNAGLGGLILDESSIIKSFTGKTTRQLIEFGKQVPFKLAATATPAPNDHMELGQHSQFLGCMDSSEMLARWFIADQRDMGRYRLKRYAVDSFWSWVASWARCISKPSDLGFSDDGFNLPELKLTQHLIEQDILQDTGGMLFRMPDTSATAIHKEKRLTARSRADRVAEIVFGDWACHGSLNTQSQDVSVQNKTTNTEPSETSKDAPKTQTQGVNTCASTSPQTESALPISASPARQSETRSAENATEPMPNTERLASNRPESDAQKKSETQDCRALSESLSKPISDCLTIKEAAAQSAEQPRPVSEASVSPSITVTQAGKSEDCSAQTAIKDLESSLTIPNGYALPSHISNGRDYWVIWCETDYEQDELERVFGDAAISIRGSQSSDTKERLHEEWLQGERKALICKPTMFGYGLNWQHCSKMAFVGLSFSYEQFYQAIRRCWRFGQQRPVDVHVVMADTEAAIWRAVQRKEGEHNDMKRHMYAAMKRAVEVRGVKLNYQPTKAANLPEWMVQA